MHHRLRPVRHRFTYSVFSLYLDLDDIGRIAGSLRLLSVERRNLLSFHAADHGARDGSPLRPWVLARLSERGITLRSPRIRLLCFPRLFGYVFNPISVYFCYDGPALAAVVYEVKNTFGGQHVYAFPVALPARWQAACGAWLCQGVLRLPVHRHGRPVRVPSGRAW